MHKITTFLTYESQAEEAASFYVSIFNNSKITHIARFGEGAPASAGTVISVRFELEGREYIALNGGSHFKFSEGISLFVNCETQEEVDTLWEKLSAGGQPGPCGWLTDQFGVSWQVIPSALNRLLSDKDPKKASRAMQAMMKMSKIDIQALEQAADGE